MLSLFEIAQDADYLFDLYREVAITMPAGIGLEFDYSVTKLKSIQAEAESDMVDEYNEELYIELLNLADLCEDELERIGVTKTGISIQRLEDMRLWVISVIQAFDRMVQQNENCLDIAIPDAALPDATKQDAAQRDTV